MATNEIDKLQISVDVDTTNAIKAYKKLANTLSRLKTLASGDLGLGKLAQQTKDFVAEIKDASAELQKLADSLSTIARITSSVRQTRGVQAITEAMQEAPKVNTNIELPTGGSDLIEAETEAVQEATTAYASFANAVATAQGLLNRTSGTQGGVDLEAYKELKALLDSISLSGEHSREELEKLNNATAKLRVQVAVLRSTGVEAQRSGARAKEGSKGWERFTANIGNIIKYRIIRKLLSEIGKAASDGSKNFYQFLNVSNSPQAKEMRDTLDSISTAMMQLSNTFGVTILTTVASLQPLLNGALKMLRHFLETINQVIALLSGSTKYWRVNEEAVKKWSDAVNHALQGFDELNVLSSDTGSNPADMFEYVDIDIKNLALEATALGGLIAAFEGLRDIVDLIIEKFKKKNKKLQEQTEKTKNEADAVGELAYQFEYAYDWIGEFVGALALIPLAFKENLFAGGSSSAFQFATDIGEAMKQALGHIWDFVGDGKDAIGNMFTKWTLSLSNWKQSFETQLSGIAEKIKKTFEGMPNGESNPQTDSAILNYAETIKNALFGGVADAKDKVQENAGSILAGVGITSAVAGIASFFSKAGSAISSGTSAVGDALGNAASMFVIPGIDFIKDIFKLNGIKDSSGIQTRAGGGFVTSGQMFIARENGLPEMVGQIGSKTAVANNEQITEAIASAVYDAMMSANRGGAVNVTLEGDAGKLFRVVQNEARSYTRATGNYAF